MAFGYKLASVLFKDLSVVDYEHLALAVPVFEYWIFLFDNQVEVSLPPIRLLMRIHILNIV
jgi:hypothetical protein